MKISRKMTLKTVKSSRQVITQTTPNPIMIKSTIFRSFTNDNTKSINILNNFSIVKALIPMAIKRL
jgi:hypothetical protein